MIFPSEITKSVWFLLCKKFAIMNLAGCG